MLGAIVALSIAGTPPPGETVWRELQSRWRPRLEPLLSEVMAFPTVPDDPEALAAQRRWLARVGPELGLVVRDRDDDDRDRAARARGRTGARAGRARGPPARERPRSGRSRRSPPRSRTARSGAAGRRRQGAAGSGAAGHGRAAELGPRSARTRSGCWSVPTRRAALTDLETYKKLHALPDLSLVLDSDFPVVVGEKAWAEWIVLAQERAEARRGTDRGRGPRRGQAVSIVPDRATLTLRWRDGNAGLGAVARAGARGEASAGDDPGDLGDRAPSGRSSRTGGRRTRAGPQPRAERAGGAGGGGARPASAVRRLGPPRVLHAAGRDCRRPRARADGGRPALGTRWTPTSAW